MRPLNHVWVGGARLLAGTAFLTALIMVAGCGGTHHAQRLARSAPRVRLRGLVPQPLPPKPSFTLTDTAGRRFDFAAQTRAKLTYLYFGYTHCPDACPTTMGDIALALRRVQADVRRRIEVVFVTVDPRRDTPRVLRMWLNHFNLSFVGLTGSEHQIQMAESAAGVPFAPSEKQRGTNYAVQHSSLVFSYSLDNRAHVVYAQGFHSSDYAHDMPLLLRY
jgi:protein SCO1